LLYHFQHYETSYLARALKRERARPALVEDAGIIVRLADAAEMAKVVVGKAVGLVTGSASADYIQLYHGNASMLAESLEVIQQTANVILAAVAPPIADDVTSQELTEIAA
jgi:hypothetical protein